MKTYLRCWIINPALHSSPAIQNTAMNTPLSVSPVVKTKVSNDRFRQHLNQVDCILVRKSFQSGVNIARTRRFPGADTESDNDLLMMTFHLHLKRISKPRHTRLKFHFQQLRDPNVLETCQAMIGGKFAPGSLTIMNHKDSDMDSMTTTLTEKQPVRSLALWQTSRKEKKKKNWVTAEILDLCNKRREVRKKRFG